MLSHNELDNLTLLIPPGEDVPSYACEMVELKRVADPGPSCSRLRRFFRPWRLVGKLFAVGVPCWILAAASAVGGLLAGFGAQLIGALTPFAVAGMNTAVMLALLPLGILAFWAALVGVYDLVELGRHREQVRAYQDALARRGDADVLTPRDLRSSGVREGLVALGYFEKMLASVDRDRERISGLLRDSLIESRRLVYRAVLELITTERKLKEWSGRLGAASSYRAKLEARRERLAKSFGGALDECLVTVDAALSYADEDSADLEQSVATLLDSCQRALAAAERDGPAIDEDELLMYAAKAREAEDQSLPQEKISE